jgi:folate-dependent tRNA-U54 methylase TrmFO/GidA
MTAPIVEVDSIDSVYERQREDARQSQLLFRRKLDVIYGLLTSRKGYNWDVLQLVQERNEWEQFYDALIAQSNSEWDEWGNNTFKEPAKFVRGGGCSPR